MTLRTKDRAKSGSMPEEHPARMDRVPVGGNERWKVEFDVRAQVAAEQ